MLKDMQSPRGNFMKIPGNHSKYLSYPKNNGLACGNDFKTSHKMMEVGVLNCSHYADFRQTLN